MENQRDKDEKPMEENKLDALIDKTNLQALATILDLIDIDLVTNDTTLTTSDSQAAAREVENKIKALCLKRMSQLGEKCKEQGFEDEWKEMLSDAEALKTGFAAERAKEESKKSEEKSS